LKEKLADAGKRALGGGLSGAAAMCIQVTTLMWLRTTMNYQYRYGTTTVQALKTLYSQGGVIRFYRGYVPALAQGPLSRFGDTAANVGMLDLLNSSDVTRNLPTVAKTLAASTSAALFRIFLMPVDSLKTIMQVEGKGAVAKLQAKIRAGGPFVLWYGALASASATLVGHFPWFFTYNTLQEWIPQQTDYRLKLVRQAGIGFTASVISDTCSNSLRVIKTYKQAHSSPITYTTAVKDILAVDGWIGLMGRGLKTRLLVNGIQGLAFSVLWKFFDDAIKKKTEHH